MLMGSIKEMSPRETRLVFVRHGQSLGNQRGIFLGHTNMDLSELGYAQAESVSQYIYENYTVSRIYSSDLMRACHTVAPLARRLHLDIEPLKTLREIKAGSWEGMSFDAIAQKYPHEHRMWATRIGLAECPNGERVADLRERIATAVAKIASENCGETVCIGSHATPLRMLMTMWNDLPLERAHEIPFPTNASVSVSIYEKERFLRCECYSFDEYLGDLRNVAKLS